MKFLGEIPNARLADDAGVRRELLEVDRERRGFRYVVAYLTPVNALSNRHTDSTSTSWK